MVTASPKKILVTGNLGYVGPNVVKEIRKNFPQATITGFDCGFFSSQVTTPLFSPDVLADAQQYGDVRKFPVEILKNTDAIIHLAAISNDPMGNRFEDVTLEINFKATVELARKAKDAGVKSFVFASSCSVYGFADDTPRNENSALNPLTAYARSKILSEEGLEKLAGRNFNITCLRFATACGMSSRLRLDLVLNDFVACALASSEISILSDGTPWRPLINTSDMARAMCWAIERENSPGNFLTVNTGNNEWNYQVKDLAEAVQQRLPETKISINKNAAPDKRSYKVSFDVYKKIAPRHQPLATLGSTIDELISGMRRIGFNDGGFRNSSLIRLNVINQLLEKNIINSNFEIIR